MLERLQAQRCRDLKFALSRQHLHAFVSGCSIILTSVLQPPSGVGTVTVAVTVVFPTPTNPAARQASDPQVYLSELLRLEGFCPVAAAKA